MALNQRRLALDGISVKYQRSGVASKSSSSGMAYQASNTISIITNGNIETNAPASAA